MSKPMPISKKFDGEIYVSYNIREHIYKGVYAAEGMRLEDTKSLQESLRIKSVNSRIVKAPSPEGWILYFRPKNLEPSQSQYAARYWRIYNYANQQGEIKKEKRRMGAGKS